MKQLFFITICLCMIMVSCQKCKETPPPPTTQTEAPKLPDATQTGAGTFGAMVNGEVWLPEDYPGFYMGPKYGPSAAVSWLVVPELGIRKGYFQLHCKAFHRPDSSDYTLRLVVDTVKSTGEFKFQDKLDGKGNLHSNYFEIYSHEQGKTIQQFYLLTGGVNRLTLTRFDTLNFIFSGTFEIDLIDSLTMETKHIRDGRFDLKTY